MGKRTALTKKTRFEVFKRDSFTCQYCGKSAPGVVLEVDHIKPVAEGGGNEILNLATSCRDCNAGKGARQLSDSSVVVRQIDQMKDIQERREQLEMLAQWREGMVDLEKEKIDAIADSINHEMAEANRVVTDSYRKDIRAMLKKYTMEEIWDAIDKSSAQYLRDVHSAQDREKYLKYIPRICYWTKLQNESPEENEICKIMGIASKRWYRCNRSELYRLIKRYHQAGHPLDVIRTNAADATGIMKFIEYMDEATDG